MEAQERLVNIFDARDFRAAFASPAEAIAARRAFSDLYCLHIEADLRESWLDRTATGLAGFVRQRAAGRTPGHQTFLALVETEAQGLSELTDPQLKECLPELRRRL